MDRSCENTHHGRSKVSTGISKKRIGWPRGRLQRSRDEIIIIIMADKNWAYMAAVDEEMTFVWDNQGRTALAAIMAISQIGATDSKPREGHLRTLDSWGNTSMNKNWENWCNRRWSTWGMKTKTLVLNKPLPCSTSMLERPKNRLIPDTSNPATSVAQAQNNKKRWCSSSSWLDPGNVGVLSWNNDPAN